MQEQQCRLATHPHNDHRTVLSLRLSHFYYRVAWVRTSAAATALRSACRLASASTLGAQKEQEPMTLRP